MSLWWRDAVFYQIYPRSFADSDGDGIGDIPGIISRLDYLSSLGVDALWISPFFPSPQRDFGYDVSDYRGVDALFGSLDDAVRLFDEAHRRGMKVVLDLVVNHSSEEHPWFKAARASRDAPEHSYYIWKPMEGPLPNNWKSLFELRSAWYPNPATGERYLATFTRHQPEFDWRNPALRREIYAIMEHWHGLGADGFRLDVATAYIKDAEFRSNPFSPKAVPDFFQRHLYDRNRPEVFEIFREMRALSGEEKVLIGETHGHEPEHAAASYGEAGDGLHLAFNFDSIRQPWSAQAFRRSMEAWYALLPEGAWPTFTLSNHDQPRHAFRFRGRTPLETEGRAKIAAALSLSLRGTPVLYYGEEIGMGCRRIPRRRLRDPLGMRTWPLAFIGRDPERTPMQWDGSPNAGFTSPLAEPWLPLNPDWRVRNVKAQFGDSDSILSRYRELIAHRRAHPALREGSLRFLDLHPDVLAFIRECAEERLLVLLNFSSLPRPVRLEEGSVLLLGEAGRERAIPSGELQLSGLETLIAALPPAGGGAGS